MSTNSASLGSVRAAPWLALAILSCAACAVAFGPDANWDLRNYHLYVAWAWLQDRQGLDLAVAQAQSWFNPLLWLPHFIAFQHLDGTALAALIAALQGLCALPLLALASRLMPASSPMLRASLVAAGMTAATLIGQLGASYGDVLLAGLALGGIVLAFDAARMTRVAVSRALCAGALFGAVAALKLSHAPVALGLCLALPVLGADRAASLRLVTLAAIGALAAFMLLAGPWAWALWRDWGNPVFPQFDAVFGGDWIAAGSGRDLRFVPASAAEAALRPLAPLFDWRATSDYRIRDARLPLLCVALAVLIVRWSRLPPVPRQLAAYIGLAFAIAYALWLALFGYHRYLVGFELVAPMMLIAVCAAAASRRVALIAVLLAVLTTNPPNHERAAGDWPAGQPISVPRAALADDTLLVLAGTQPLAYVLPFLPPFAGAVRIESNFMPVDRERRRLHALIGQRIAAHGGRMVLLVQADAAAADAALGLYGLRRTIGDCVDIADALQQTDAAPLRLCPLERVTR